MQAFDGSEGITKTEQEIVYIVTVSSDGGRGRQSWSPYAQKRPALNIGMYTGIGPKLRQLVAVGRSDLQILCTARTLENFAKSADCSVPHCETFNRSVEKLLQFYFQKVGAKNTAMLEEIL